MKKTIILIVSIVYLCLSAKSQTDTKYLPIVFFKNNSTVFDTLYNYSENTENIRDTNNIIKFMANFLKNRPQIKIRINGYIDFKENGKDTLLSFERAKKIEKLLIEEGVSENRMIIRAMGYKKQFVQQKLIAKEKVEGNRELLRRYNRRVTFIIIS